MSHNSNSLLGLGGAISGTSNISIGAIGSTGPSTYVGLSYHTSNIIDSKFNKHEIEIELLKQQNVTLTETVNLLQSHIKTLDEKFNAIWYAPTFPGFVESSELFIKHMTKNEE